MSRVGVLGDPMQDVYWLGEAKGLSAEAPIPVVKVGRVLEFAGGAANVAANLEGLGVDAVRLYSPSPLRPIKNRLMVGEVQAARWDERDTCLPPTSLDLHLLDACVVSDYAKGGVTPWLVDELVASGVPLFVDTKRDPSEWLRAKQVVVFPNNKEYLQHPSPYNQFEVCVHKLGSAGMELLSRGERWATEPTLARRVRSVNGAGDSALAGFVVEHLHNGCEVSKAPRALRWASAAAALAVEHPYTHTVKLEEVKARLKNAH